MLSTKEDKVKFNGLLKATDFNLGWGIIWGEKLQKISVTFLSKAFKKRRLLRRQEGICGLKEVKRINKKLTTNT